MSLFKFNPTSPGLRNKIKIFNDLYKGKPFKKLNKNIISSSGRGSFGHITTRHRGGRAKRNYRFIDFFRTNDGVKGRIERIEYDPNRYANICLVLYFDGSRRYIIHPKDLFIGDIIISGKNSPIKVGNNLFLKYIPTGVKIHCVEISPGSGAIFSRSPGCYCVVVSKSFRKVTISLKSGVLLVLNDMCRATIGEIGNSDHNLVNFGKAGSKRLLGFRPTVRGVAMNPVDHPHGGGEGKTSGGRDPVSPWGRFSKSLKKKKK